MDTLNQTPSIENYLQRAVYWYIKDEDTFLASTSGHRDETNAVVPASMLNNCHPELATTLREMIHFNNRTGLARANGRMVEASKDYLLGEYTELPTANGNRKMHVRLFEMEVIPSKGIVRVGGQAITLKHISSPAGLVALATPSDYGSYGILVEDMNRLFAGWDKRLVIGAELGLQGRDLMKYVLNESPSLNNTVSDLTFD